MLSAKDIETNLEALISRTLSELEGAENTPETRRQLADLVLSRCPPEYGVARVGFAEDPLCWWIALYDKDGDILIQGPITDEVEISRVPELLEAELRRELGRFNGQPITANLAAEIGAALSWKIGGWAKLMEIDVPTKVHVGVEPGGSVRVVLPSWVKRLIASEVKA